MFKLSMRTSATPPHLWYRYILTNYNETSKNTTSDHEQAKNINQNSTMVHYDHVL